MIIFHISYVEELLSIVPFKIIWCHVGSWYWHSWGSVKGVTAFPRIDYSQLVNEERMGSSAWFHG